MIDFTNCEVNKYKYYGGKNGGKICVVYDNKDYMLKFPSSKHQAPHDYSSSVIPEYISCLIIKEIGLPVQEVLLGNYWLNGVEKNVVACLDFTSNDKLLKLFAEFKNSQIETSKSSNSV